MAECTTGTRRRGSVLEEAILDATIEELTAVGYANLKMEHVAARAGAGKASLYKRWPTRASLVRAALMDVVSTNFDEQRLTGDTFADLKMMMRFVARIFESPVGEYFRGLVGESSPKDPAEPEFAAWMEAMRERSVKRILEAGIARGDVRADAHDPLISSVPFDMIISRYVMSGVVPDNAVIDQMMDKVVKPLLRL